MMCIVLYRSKAEFDVFICLSLLIYCQGLAQNCTKCQLYSQLKERIKRAIDNYGRSDRLTFLHI